MDHLALAVRDQERSRRFYERYLGFAAESVPRSDGVLMLHRGGFSLALGETAESIRLPGFLHFGKGLESPEAVRAFRDGLAADGVEVVGEWEEPDYVSVKFRDPDGYVVEVSWEPESTVRERES
jgi:catechol 2,3-dioxygenase-like lactoylglutathione lyase family enzyme